MFQVVKISFRVGERTKNVQFLGPFIFTDEEWEEIKQKPMAEVITGFSIGEPEDPFKYAETDPEITELMETIREKQEIIHSHSQIKESRE